MRVFVLSVLLGLAAVLPATGQGSDIRATIEAQVEAFRADDYARAFTFASPTIRGLFGTPENFRTMVQRGYPMVVAPADVRFLEQRERAGGLWQKVLFRDADGGVHILDYEMIQTEDGWLINAVQLIKAPDIAA